MLVSTHYMDEAERCHRLAYIAYGRLLASGTPDELVRETRLATWDVHGPNASAAAEQLEATPGVELVTRFGNALHVSGRDAAALDAAVAKFSHIGEWQRLPATLEDVFIFLMRHAEDQFKPQAPAAKAGAT